MGCQHHRWQPYLFQYSASPPCTSSLSDLWFIGCPLSTPCKPHFVRWVFSTVQPAPGSECLPDTTPSILLTHPGGAECLTPHPASCSHILEEQSASHHAQRPAHTPWDQASISSSMWVPAAHTAAQAEFLLLTSGLAGAVRAVRAVGEESSRQEFFLHVNLPFK